jgi:hypothetical protein
MHFLRLFAALFASSLIASTALAQAYPVKPVE